jgi:hypothetical protein
MPFKKRFEVRVQISVRATITVDADNEADAQQRLKRGAWHSVDVNKHDLNFAEITHRFNALQDVTVTGPDPRD